MEAITNDILQHIGDRAKSNWYVGIATDVKDRLFSDHNVDEKNGSWIFRKAASEKEARDIEQSLLDNYSFKGGTGGGGNPQHVYAYQITSSTREDR